MDNRRNNPGMKEAQIITGCDYIVLPEIENWQVGDKIRVEIELLEKQNNIGSGKYRIWRVIE